MYVLGIHNGHNATACLIKDGEILDCISEERFNHKKNYSGIPKKTLEYILNKRNLKPTDIALIGLSYKYGGGFLKDEENAARLKISKYLFNSLYSAGTAFKKILTRIEIHSQYIQRLNWFLNSSASKFIKRPGWKSETDQIADFLSISSDKIIAFDHHKCHAYSAYFSSPFRQKDALVLTLDGEGDLLCSSVWKARKDKLERIAATPANSSLGLLYMSVTQYLGMKANEHEYKVMGLAPYAKGEKIKLLYDKIKNIITLDPNNPLSFKSIIDTHLSYRYLKKILEGERFDIIAAAFQKLTEERVTEWISKSMEKTGIKRIILSGGVFMNVKANQKILEKTGVKELFIMPSCGDESTPIGAAMLAYLQQNSLNKKVISKKLKPLKNLYFGPSFANGEIELFLQKKGYFNKYKIEKYKEIEKKIAQLLASRKIVARLSGRMEWGARALGNRSILAHPSDVKIVRVINDQIKGRDFWMPFAPTILKERMSNYCLNKKNIQAPYMIVSFNSTKLAQKELRAAIHQSDFTLRPQVMQEEWNPKYYKIIKEFEKRTGIGAVLNTSFNLHGYPIVLGPKEAMWVFQRSKLEYLALENYLISRK